MIYHPLKPDMKVGTIVVMKSFILKRNKCFPLGLIGIDYEINSINNIKVVTEFVIIGTGIPLKFKWIQVNEWKKFSLNVAMMPFQLKIIWYKSKLTLFC